MACSAEIIFAKRAPPRVWHGVSIRKRKGLVGMRGHSRHVGTSDKSREYPHFHRRFLAPAVVPCQHIPRTIAIEFHLNITRFQPANNLQSGVGRGFFALFFGFKRKHHAICCERRIVVRYAMR